MKKILRFRKPFAVVLCLVLLTATAYAAGYTNLSHFSNSFKEKYGMSPKEYRKSR